MARRGRITTYRRSSSSPQIAKLKARLAAKSAKQRSESKELFADIAAVGGGALLGWLDTQSWTDKVDIPGIDDAAVYGLIAYIVGSNVSGKIGATAKGFGVGMLSCAARDFVNGDAK